MITWQVMEEHFILEGNVMRTVQYVAERYVADE